MSLHPVLAEKLTLALAPAPAIALTMRDVELPKVADKVHAVIGMWRAGKTTYLRQLLERRRAASAVERSVYLGFDDDRLAGLELRDSGGGPSLARAARASQSRGQLQRTQAPP